MGDQSWDGIDRRGAGAQQQLVAAIAQAIRDEMSSLTVPEDQHREHHEFIRTWIDRERARAARRDRLREKVSGWLIVSALGAVGTGVYNAAIYIRGHLR